MLHINVYQKSWNLGTSLRLTPGLILFFLVKKKTKTLFKSNYLVSAKNCEFLVCFHFLIFFMYVVHFTILFL